MASVSRHSPTQADSLSNVTFNYSGLREERHLVRCLLSLYILANLSYLLALLLSKKS